MDGKITEEEIYYRRKYQQKEKKNNLMRTNLDSNETFDIDIIMQVCSQAINSVFDELKSNHIQYFI